MLLRALCCSGVVIGMFATGALGMDYSAPQAGHPSVENGVYQRHHSGMRLPKELKMMWRQEEHAHIKALPKDQRRGWLRAKWAAMTDQQKQTKTAELQAKWNALPPSVRENLLEKKRQKHEAKLMRKSGQDNESNQPRSH